MFFERNFKVDFICVGVQKAGTSALDAYFRQHSGINMPRIKETHFFDNDKYFTDKPDYSQYHNSFDITQRRLLNGEVTPSYIYWENSIQRIYEYNHRMKIIVILRNPIERAFSNWNMEVMRGNETRLFMDCVLDGLSNLLKLNKSNNLYHSYLERGFYKNQVEKLYEFFPDKQIHFVKYENFVKNQKDQMDRIFNFLRLNPSLFKYNEVVKNKIQYSENISLEAKKMLGRLYSNDIQYVENVLGWDCNDWKI
ncbi:MAG: hypothetical protein CMC08_09430 [Flavobacteriaceae bacterium]|mgnify:CR=1 FL=1|nr:hypothetical protein [Flavobacteriaceae bacterium]|tara:strand:- start:326 stop:1081 length:756 start_codon:yes stop_codon:yes gene_type:complete